MAHYNHGQCKCCKTTAEWYRSHIDTGNELGRAMDRREAVDPAEWAAGYIETIPETDREGLDLEDIRSDIETAIEDILEGDE